jgi:uncharacterized protein YndB with AHSA1/START domain
MWDGHSCPSPLMLRLPLTLMLPLNLCSTKREAEMSTTTITPDQDAVVSEIEIAAPPGRVFQALTTTAELKRWFTSPDCPAKLWEMDPRPGGRYAYATEKGSVVVNGVSEFECHGEILEYDPPHVLAYTWLANWHDDVARRTIVRWELTPTKAGTHVKVTHSGLAQEAAARKDYSNGWPGVVQMLKSFVEQ